VYGCASVPQISEDGNSEDVQGFTQKQTTVIKDAIAEWKAHYVCGRSIQVRPFKGTTKVTQKEKNVRVRETILETAGPGRIRIDPDMQYSLRDPMLHAMTHACTPDDPYMLPKPIQFKDGVIIGYKGAKIMVRLKNGTETFFTKLEEGLCERNASFLTPYTNHNNSYFRVAQLARNHFPKGIDPMPLIRNNDVPGLAAIMFKKSNVTDYDIESIIMLYERVWEGE
jgi:hypothetical protein